MKKFLSMIALFIFTVILVSCTNSDGKGSYPLTNNNFESFYEIDLTINKNDNKYNLLIEEKYDFTVSKRKASIKLYFTHKEDNKLKLGNVTIDISSDNLKVGQLRSGDTVEPEFFYYEVLTATGKIKTEEDIKVTNKTYKVPPFTEEPLQKDLVSNVEANTKNKELANDLLKIFTNKEVMSPHTTVISENEIRTVDYSGGVQKQSFKFELNRSSDYLGIFNEEFNGYETTEEGFVFNKNKDFYLGYELSKDNYYNGIYSITPIVVSNDEINNIIPEELVFDYKELTFDPTKVIFEVNGNNIKVEGYIIDIISKEEYALLELVYQSLGLDTKILKSMTTLYSFNVYDNKLTIENKAIININTPFIKYTETITRNTVSFEEFEKIDISDESKFEILRPDTIDKVYEETNLLEPVSANRIANPHFYYTYLEAGQYSYEGYGKEFRFNFYDNNKNIVDVKLLGELGNSDEFFITKSGYYYVEIKLTGSMTYDGYRFNLVKRDFDDYYHTMESVNVSNDLLNFKIEGAGDYVKAVVESKNDNEILTLTLNGSNGIVVFYQNNSPYQKYERTVMNNNYNNPLQIHLKRGINELIFTSDQYASFELKVEIDQYDLKYYESEYQKMVVLTDEFTDFIPISEITGSAYFKFSVSEKSFITVLIEAYYSGYTGYVQIFDFNNNNLVQHAGNKVVILSAGNYYISISNSNGIQSSKIKIDIKTYEDILLTFPIDSVSNLDDIEKLDYHNFILMDKEHYAILNLKFDSGKTVFIEAKKFKIYDELGNIVVDFYIGLSYISNGSYYFLEAGSYKIVFSNEYNSESEHQIKVLYVDNNLTNNYNDGTTKHFIDLDKQYTFTKDNKYDKKLVCFRITDKDYYTTERYLTNIVLMDEKGNVLGDTFGTRQFEPGIYSIRILFTNDDPVTLNIVKYYYY